MRPPFRSSPRRRHDFQSAEGTSDETSYNLDYTHDDDRPSTSRAAAEAAAASISNTFNTMTRRPTVSSGAVKYYAKKSTSRGQSAQPQKVGTALSSGERQRGRKQIKPKRYRNKNLQFIREVMQLQNRTDFLMPKSPFARLVRETIQATRADVSQISRVALEALQEATEMYLTQMFNDAYLLTVHRQRVTLAVKDIELLRVLKLIN